MKSIICAMLRPLFGAGSFGLAGLLVLALAGCSPTLRVETTPSNALVTVRDAVGKEIAHGASPLAFRVNFGKAQAYSVTVEPGADNRTQYEPVTKRINQADYRTLQRIDGGAALLKVELPADYKTITSIVATPSAEGWSGFIHTQRAFRDPAEQGGATPTRIVEFEQSAEDVAIHGMGISPDGHQIVYSVAKYNLKNADERQAIVLDNRNRLSIGRLAYANLRGIALAAGDAVQHITDENFEDLYPSFTSDGKYLLFSSNRRRRNGSDLLRIRADGHGGISNIYLDRRDYQAVKPTQGSDGTLAFALYRSDWRSPADVEIWTVGGNNTYPTQIARGMQPTISPDGQYIAYIGPDGNLWVSRSDGTEATQLTNDADSILSRLKSYLSGEERSRFDQLERNGTVKRYYHPFSFPSWSPDAKRILYTSMAGSDRTGRPNQDIWIMGRDGSNQRQLTTNGSADSYPVMSPDQKWVYFISNRGFHENVRWAIWRINAPEAAGP